MTVEVNKVYTDGMYTIVVLEVRGRWVDVEMTPLPDASPSLGVIPTKHTVSLVVAEEWARTSPIWIDVRWTEYPRLVTQDVYEVFVPDAETTYLQCEHDRRLTEECVACHGLSILAKTRR